jgi:hypothetical protein
LQLEGQYIVEEAETESKLETLGRTMREGLSKAMDAIPKLMPKVKEAFNQMETHLSDPETIDRLANDAAQQVDTENNFVAHEKSHVFLRNYCMSFLAEFGCKL